MEPVELTVPRVPQHGSSSSRRLALVDSSGSGTGASDPLTLIRVRAAAFNRLSACAVVLDGRGVVLDSNESWRLFTHLNQGDVATTGRGTSYLEVCDRSAAAGADGAAEVAAGLREILRGERDRFDLEYSCPSPIEDRWFLLQASAAPVADGNGVVVQHVDITAKKLAANAMNALADNDALTGLPSRRSALRYLEQQIESSGATRSPLSVLYVDLDGFKAVNDQYGHHVGDELLVKVAVRLRRVVRQQDHVCRLGGDEFVLICPGLDRKAATLVAHRLRTVMSAPFQIEDLEVNAGASVGVAMSSADSSVEDLIDAADSAMHLDKQGATRRRELGRNPTKPSASKPWPAEPLRPMPARLSNSNDGIELAAALTALQARSEAAFAHSGDLVLFFASDGTVLSASPASRAMFGVEPDELIGLNSLNLVHPDDQERMLREVASIPNLGDSFRAELRIIDQDGKTRWLEEIVTNLIADPNVGCFVSNVRDVTERVELLERIDADRQRLADAQATAKLGSFELNTETGAIRRSDEFRRMLGLPPGSSEREPTMFGHPDDVAQIEAAFAAVSAGEGPVECVHRIVRADGEIRWVRLEISQSGASNGNIVIGTLHDITERHQAEETLAHQATHDWLTQLPNVASLHATLDDALGPRGSELKVVLAVLDIDDFGLVNDRNGHVMGDATLRSVADRLVTGLPHGDLIARLDGDAFAVVCTDSSAYCDTGQLGDAILSVLREPFTVGEHGVHVVLTASVGVALSTASDSASSLLRDADDAMRHAKTSGKSRVTVFDDEARSRGRRRRTLSTALRLALARGELHVEYQPVIDLATLATVGFEALLRWQHPDLGVISPLEFIPLAEAGGAILPIGDWVVEQAVRQLAVWHGDPRVPKQLWMAINVSATQLAQPLFADEVVEAVRSADVPLAAIHLEITESVLVDRIDNALRTIEELRSAGFNISIDDFGTGYSSLSYLSRMPVDTLKIDRSFVAGLGDPGPASSIIRTITTLADSLELDTVAEGVESPLQLERLKQLGCRNGQGFLWGAGFRPDDALAWMIGRIAREALPSIAT